MLNAAPILLPVVNNKSSISPYRFSRRKATIQTILIYLFMKTKFQKCATLVAMSAVASATWAQGNGVAALEKANAEITSYVEPMTKLFYVVCAVIGLIGAIKVYGKWSAGSSDTTKTAASWFGACVFAVVAVTAIRAFFIG